MREKEKDERISEMDLSAISRSDAIIFRRVVVLRD